MNTLTKPRILLKSQIEVTSVALGLLAGVAVMLLLGAANPPSPHQPLAGRMDPLRFLVVSATPHEDGASGMQNVVLHLAPAHLTAKRLRTEEPFEEFCRQQNETRELTVVAKADSRLSWPTNTVMVLQPVELQRMGGVLLGR